MSTFSDQLETIKTLVSSNSKPDRSHAYSTLLHLQEQASDDSCSIAILLQHSKSLVSMIVEDVSDDDEEIAAQALKCLGFVIYHPSIVANIPEEDANLIIERLVKIITTTKIKSVCNLGVWCISIQQLNTSVLSFHHHSLLRAVVHGLDNPFGSLSTTFEATQAVIKLANQLTDKMRESSYMWVPPIYRRLLSVDKRERDMSERCLLKIKSIVLPAPLSLSKALLQDMKQRLLTGMKELLSQGMKVQAIQAWGWYIRFLGSYAVKNRHLVNDMLKIPEQTFSDHDAQVHIASQAAWEGLIDALIESPVSKQGAHGALVNGIQHVQTSFRGNAAETEAKGLLKSIKLIMMPLIGIMSSRCDLSIHSSCINTWLYVLHKLNTSLNCSSVIELVLQPILNAVFQSDSGSRCSWLWNLCIDVLDDFIKAKCRYLDGEQGKDVGDLISIPCMPEASLSGKGLWKQYSIKWCPWDLSQTEALLNMISIIIRQASASTETHENCSPFEAAMQLYRSVLKGVCMELKKSSTTYDDSMSCLGTILNFNKRIYEDAFTDKKYSKELLYTGLLFIQAVIEELEPSVLASPLYKVSLDLKYIENLPLDDSLYAEIHRRSSVVHMGMVSPIIYLIALYFSLAIHSTSNSLKMKSTQPRMHTFFERLFSLYEPVESLLPIIDLLYRHVGFNYLHVWTEIAKGLADCISALDNLSAYKVDSNSTSYLTISHLLLYPFFSCCSTSKEITMSVASGLTEQSTDPSHECLNRVTEMWKLLFTSLNSSQDECGSYLNLCSSLFQFLDKEISMHESDQVLDFSRKNISSDIFTLSGNVAICALEILIKLASDKKENQHDHDGKLSSGINYSLEFASRFVKLSQINIKMDTNSLSLISRVFSLLAQLVSSLVSEKEIVSFAKIISTGLLPWLSLVEIRDGQLGDQLQLLWVEILKSLQRSQPPIIFDTAFLKFQAPLLEKTLDHPDPSIAESTVKFWNSTYSLESNLDYPQILFNVLDKLSRTRKFILHRRCTPFLVNCQSKDVDDSKRCQVTATTNNMTSKRIELVETRKALKHQGVPLPNLKRKRLELTERQKEVRRAQKGRDRDCGGHGPGIRTYTSLDFSQGNDESQDSLEF